MTAAAAAAEQFDAIVIGTGQAGKPLALALAEAGKRTAVLEREHVGGSCINYGCTPTKTMVASARVAHLARRGGDYGVRTGDVGVDLKRVRERKRSIVESFRGGSRKALEEADGVELIFGHGRFADGETVAVEVEEGVRRLRAPWIFVNTGTRAAHPPIEGLEEVSFLDNATIMELGEVPEHLVVVGGGYVGLEFGQMFRRFGSEVTIVQRGDQLLTREDGDVADAVREILQEDGIEVLLETEATSVGRKAGGIRVEVSSSGGPRALAGSHLLLAAGRRPNSDGLGLEATEVEVDDRGFLQVNERLETASPGIYALGDVTGGPAFTHISYDDFRVVRTNLLDGGSATTRDRLVPYTVFLDPQLGRVGLTEAEARERDGEFRVAKLPMSRVARALEMDETRGFMKAVVDAGTDRILGCAILGVEGGEVMSVLQTAMMGDLPYTAIRDGVFAHPTLAESLNNLFQTLE